MTVNTVPDQAGAQANPWPPAAESMADLGLPDPFLRELALKILHYAERLTVSGLAQRMRIPRILVDEITREMRREKLIEYVAGVTQNYENVPFRLTDLGQQRAGDALKRSRYAGAAPVPLDQYNRVVETLLAQRQRVSRSRLKESLSHLVFAPEVLDSVCAAMHSGRACLLYGPPGNGKTEIVTSFANCLDSGTLVPHAIYTYGQVIKAFDRLHHIPLPPSEHKFGAAGPKGNDERWVPIRTPVVMVGGELTRDALELGYDEHTGFHQLPPHLKAQNGFFVVDDFGRQKMRPDEMLNRWIVPMERSIDMFAMHTGEIVTMPFDVTLVLSTNLQPTDLMDEALQRRIPYKVEVPAPSPQELYQILQANAESLGVECERAGIDHFMQKAYNSTRDPRACMPRDLLRIIVDGSTFYGETPRLTPEAVDRAWGLSFGPDALGKGAAGRSPKAAASAGPAASRNGHSPQKVAPAPSTPATPR
jgi:predicted ATPase with chaperone activity